jgi:hypothetical protein
MIVAPWLVASPLLGLAEGSSRSSLSWDEGAQRSTAFSSSTDIFHLIQYLLC